MTQRQESWSQITDRESIKKTSLDHCVKVLSKNKLREKDDEEQKIKEENHKIIMRTENKDEYELDKDLYNKVLKRISDKGKRMFDLLNKSGDKYKDAIFWYIKKIIKNETTPLTSVVLP